MTSGRQALTIFHDEQVRLFNVPYSLDELISQVGPKWFPESLSNAFELDENLTPSRISNAMLSLARMSQGKIPLNYQVFLSALTNQVQKIDFKAFLEITENTLTDTKNIAVNAGATYGAYKILALLIPIVLYFLNKKEK